MINAHHLKLTTSSVKLTGKLVGNVTRLVLVRERSALATLIVASRVCLSVILSVRNFGAKYLGNEAR